MDKQAEWVLQLRRAGRHLRVLESARELLEAKPLFTAGEWCHVYRAAAMSAMDLGRPLDGVQWAERCHQVAAEAQAEDLIAPAAYLLGSLYVYVGDMHLGLQYTDQFLAIDTPRQPSLSRYRGPAWFNRATALMNRRRYEEAAIAFTNAHDAFDVAGDRHRMAETLLQAAWMETLAGRLDVAQQNLRSATEQLQELQDPDLEISRLCHHAFLTFKQQDFEGALQLCDEVFVPGRPGVTSRHLAAATWVAGECALAQNMLTEAGMFADLATDHAVRATWPFMMNQAADLRRRVRAAGEQPA